jgi:hypothetical protein
MTNPPLSDSLRGSVNSHRLGASHSPWLDDTSYNNSLQLLNRLSHFGVAMRNLDYGELEEQGRDWSFDWLLPAKRCKPNGHYAYRLGPIQLRGVNADHV